MARMMVRRMTTPGWKVRKYHRWSTVLNILSQMMGRKSRFT